MKPSSTEPEGAVPDAPPGGSAGVPRQSGAPAEETAPGAARLPEQRRERSDRLDRAGGPRRRTRAEEAGLSELPVDRPGVAATDRVVRPARLDRQLRRSAIDPAYSDQHLEEIVAKAAEAARERARAEGYAAGWAEGRQAAAEQARQQAAQLAEEAARRLERDTARLRQLIAQLGEAVLTARRSAIPEWEEVADAVADGAIRIARAAMARELRSIDEPVADAVRRGLERIADPGEAVIHLHPDDAATVGASLPEGLRVVPDPTVPAGGVVVLTPAQRLRLDLPSALAAAERVLRS
jgi:flagellar assembly protein FliH